MTNGTRAEIQEPARNVPVIHETDVCVVGGSCTGVFAAVRAARLGLKVAILEKQNSFGGVATQGLVGVWHSLKDTEHKRPIIAGLTRETLDRLAKRDAAETIQESHDVGAVLNTEELKIELDELVVENGIRPFLHTLFAAPWLEDGRLAGVLVENKSGRGLIRARFFIDATGDGDLAHRMKLPFTLRRQLQPPTTCARLCGVEGISIPKLIREHGKEFGLPPDWGWSGPVTGVPGVTFHAETHVFDVNCAEADDLTRAEIEGRRTVRAYMDIVRQYGGRKPGLVDLAACIGIRETRHMQGAYRLTEQDVLTGKAFPDAIAYGSYRVDVHHEDRDGITFRYLDGSEDSCEKGVWRHGRWRPETAVNPTFYQVPFRAMTPPGVGNLLVCGRAIDTDGGAFGAYRVMVNCNQTGEAAGVAAWLALASNQPVDRIDIDRLRRTLVAGGSILDCA